jgi:hypothetical protein
MKTIQISSKYIVLLVMATLLSCGSGDSKEVVINPSEVGVYYDLETETFVTIKTGTHDIPKSSQLFTYSLAEVSLKEEVRFKTKDKKRFRATIAYQYRPKTEGMGALHSKEGKYYGDLYVKPFVFSKVRTALNIPTDSISVEKATEEVKIAIVEDEDFSKRIETLSFKVTNIISEE